MNTRECRYCGQEATERLAAHYRYPRAEVVPQAMDPWHVNGGAGGDTCGSPPCEASLALELRALILGAHPDADIAFARPADITVTEHEDGTATMSWPAPPAEDPPW